MWTRIGKLAKAFLMFLVISSGMAHAQETSLDATVNSNKISLQDVLELTVTVHGAKGNIPTIPSPAVNGFETRYVGPSSKLMIVNGISSQEYSFTYNLFPSKVGRFEIPPISLTLDGKTYVTSPIEIEVVDKPSATGHSQDQKEESIESIQDKVFMKASLGKEEVYVGQKTPLIMKVYVKDLSLQLASAPYLTPNGFVADSTANMRKSPQIVNGVNFDTLTFDTNIYPTKPGRLMVGPFQADGNLIYHVKYNNDFLGDFFGREEARPITLKAPEVSLNVLALPEQGQPKGFAGAVGEYAFKATVSPSLVKLGDPLTLRMTISGEGRIKDLIMPDFHDSRFKTYDPQIKEQDNSKTLEQVIIPINQNITEVPAISFSYFDPNLKEYKTITQGPFPINVLPQGKGEEFKAYGFIDKTKDENRPVVVSFDNVKKLLTSSIHRIKLLAQDWRLWMVFGLLGFTVLGLKIKRIYEKRLMSDPALARRLKAYAQAQQGIKKAHNLLKKESAKEFYDVVFRIIRDYLANKFHKPSASLTFEVIQTALKEREIDEFTISVIKALFDKSDEIRFAAGFIDESGMRQDFQKLQEVISSLHKRLK